MISSFIRSLFDETRQLGRDVTEIRRRSCLPSSAILHLPVLNTMKFFEFERSEVSWVLEMNVWMHQLSCAAR